MHTSRPTVTHVDFTNEPVSDSTSTFPAHTLHHTVQNEFLDSDEPTFAVQSSDGNDNDLKAWRSNSSGRRVEVREHHHHHAGLGEVLGAAAHAMHSMEHAVEHAVEHALHHEGWRLQKTGRGQVEQSAAL